MNQRTRDVTPLPAEESVRERYPEGPRSLFGVAGLLSMRENPLEFLVTVRREFGDIAYTKFGPRHVFVVSHPDLARQVLVQKQADFAKTLRTTRASRLLGNGLFTNESATHLIRRRQLQSALHGEQLKSYVDMMPSLSVGACANWHSGEQINVYDHMVRLTIRLVLNTLFGLDSAEDCARVLDAVQVAPEFFARMTNPLAGLMNILPLPSTRRLRNAQKQLDTVADHILERYRHTTVHSEGIIPQMLGSSDKSAKDDMRGEIRTLILTGHETTAVALTWTIHLLAKHPDVQADVEREVDSVLQRNLPSSKNLSSLHVLRHVVAESLRLFPPAYAISRRAIRDTTLGNHDVPRGSTVYINTYSIHHDGRFFADPNKFLPERWNKESEMTQYSYLPFGAGIRSCIGDSYAVNEMMIVLAVLCKEWLFHSTAGYEPLFHPLITLRPRGGLPVILEHRHHTCS